jgi:hypothetical protein
MDWQQEPGPGGVPAMAVNRAAFPCLTAIAVLMLLAMLCCPASADTNATASSPNGIATRQAHLAWTALEKETEMKAAITYVSTLFSTDTTNMSADLAAFQAEEAGIPAAASDTDLSALITDMKNTTTLFRNDTGVQMTVGQGRWDELGQQIGAATSGNPYITGKENAYWTTRSTGTLADFDAWVTNSRQVLDSLNAEGYNTSAAQRTLDGISFSRPDLQSALASRSDDDIASASQQILAGTRAFAGQVAVVQEQVPEGVRQQFFIDQGYRAVERADTVNHDLTMILIDIGPADPALSKTKNDLAASRNVLNTGNFGAARTPLQLVQEDMRNLAQAYEGVTHSADLPPALSAELSSMAVRLDDAADQIGASL